jgi:hypothetical protein
MAKFKVLSPVKHKHKVHAIGAILDLQEDVAKPLLDVGVIEADKPEKAETRESKK